MSALCQLRCFAIFLPILFGNIQWLAGARGIEPRSKVLETFILTVVLCPYTEDDYIRYTCFKKEKPSYVTGGGGHPEYERYGVT